MLGKMFFNAEPYNPRPNFDGSVINLSGGEKYDDNTIWSPGRYAITVQAGSCYPATDFGSSRIYQEILITQPFIIRAYCGSKGTSTSAGTNPYSGPFKVNSMTTNQAVPDVSHIFGNAGSVEAVTGVYATSAYQYSSGNCLGNGAFISGKSIGAGSCLHIMPIGGTFGTDYLFAFHCASGTLGTANSRTYGGCGSAYGGAGSGSAINLGGTQGGPATANAGGNTPYGVGGAGHTVITGSQIGYSGSGIGYGYGGGVSGNGAGAWFNGTQWVDSRTVGGLNEDGCIKVEYLSAV